MDSRSCISPYQNDKLDNLISLVEKLMQKYESFESKLDGNCDIADAAKLESRITRLEDKFTQWDLQAETRLQSLEQKAQTTAVDCITEKTNGPTDEELIKMVVQEEMTKKTEEERDIENWKKSIIVYRVPEKTQSVTERKANDEHFVTDLLDAVFNVKLEEAYIDKMYRLGQWSEEKARPLLIAFKNCELKQHIMDNARNLKQQQIFRFRGIGMSHDLPPKERAEIKQMVKQAKEEHVGHGDESAENFWFMVVGCRGQRRRVLKIKNKPPLPQFKHPQCDE